MARVADSTVPRVPDLLKPALDQMMRLGGSAANTEMDDAVADAVASIGAPPRHCSDRIARVAKRIAWRLQATAANSKSPQ